MKKSDTILTALAATLLCLLAWGCKKNEKFIIPLPQGPEYVGEYMETSDVLRIGHALNTLATRMTVKWENPKTGYQFSMIIFSSDSAKGKTTRAFTVLTIGPDNQGETLDLKGVSDKAKHWRIVAVAPAASIGTVARMPMEETPVPDATTSSGQNFQGFIVAD